MKRHGAPQEKLVGANLVRVEPQELEADLGSMEAEEVDYVISGDTLRNCALGKKIGADGGVRFGMV